MVFGLETTLAATAAPLVATSGGSLRDDLQRITRLDCHAVQLSAAMSGLRPRELNRRARRDLLAMLSRHALMLAGVDLMIPRKDWLSAERVDRAVTATLDAIDFAADLGRVPLSLPLPVKELTDDVKTALTASADGHDVPLAVHAEDQPDDLIAWLDEQDQPVLRAGLDAAAALALQLDPAEGATRLSDRLLVARLDDYSAAGVASGAGRVPVGEGDLDVTEFKAAVVTAGSVRTVVVELRDLRDPGSGLSKALDAWGA